MSECLKCGLAVKKTEKITCSNCSKPYHNLCVNITASAYKRLSKIARASWNCPTCTKSHQQNKSMTDDDEELVETSESEEQDTSKDSRLRRIIRDEIKNTMRSELKHMIREMRLEMDEMRKQLEKLKSSGIFDISQVNDLKIDLSKLQRENSDLRSQNFNMQENITQLKIQLNTLDQNLRDSNLEINGLPENKSEILPNVVIQLAKAVSYELRDTDILKSTRVASISSNKSRPRTVIVKLRSPRCRDELFSAVTRYNKSHSDDKLNTSILGYSGHKQPIYVSEHLSPVFKSLHASARLKAKEKSYKFVWVRYGKIFVCKDENSSSILIRNEQCLDKIV